MRMLRASFPEVLESGMCYCSVHVCKGTAQLSKVESSIAAHKKGLHDVDYRLQGREVPARCERSTGLAK